MKKSLIAAALLIACSLSPVRSTAVPIYTDTDLWGVTLVPGKSVTGTFDIAGGDGGLGDISSYNPATQQINSAFAIFLFSNSSGSNLSVQVGLDGLTQSVNSWIGLFVYGQLVNALVDLSSDGVVQYTVSNAATPGIAGNSIWFGGASLVAIAGPRTGVPDGGWTLGLLGAGLLVLSIAHRRQRLPIVRA